MINSPFTEGEFWYTVYSMESLSKEQKKHFQLMIFNWWKIHRRDLPWRHTHNTYNIFISEIMLQQTQVSRVIPKYIEFLKKFPTIEALAKAKTAHVLRIWKGMGYNRRALYIHQAAKQILQDYNGKFPRKESELVQLPGLGKYTARALLVFVYKKDIPLVDTNIRKILTHFFFNDTPQPERLIYQLAQQLIPIGKSWEWHQALMDYGALELPNSFQKNPLRIKTRKKGIPFTDSDRYYRGRIIDILRECTYAERNLLKTLQKNYKKKTRYFQSLLAVLLKEGLISRSSGGIISLPD